MSKSCEHGIVSGECMWCLAVALERESAAVNDLRNVAYEAEMERARRRVESQDRRK